MMRVKVTTVYNYAVWHDYFPEAATPAGQRPPRFRKADVDAYIARRSIQAVGTPGRPVKTMDVGERVSREQGDRASTNIRTRLAASDAPRHQEIVDALGISKPALKARLRRETRWKVTELERIAAMLGTSGDELTRESDA
ncbi:hypothetical protein [Clavibacter nebraskensis]|uniref:hypothetical protein n=1 Tax=Clavibacter nebraskensis TaxID=31963 RepID=UPI003F4B1C9B